METTNHKSVTEQTPKQQIS